MIILDEQKLKDFWDGIAAGFQKSPLEVVLSLVALALIVTVPIVLFVIGQRRQKRRRAARAEEAFSRYVAKLDIGEGERDLLREMSRYTAGGKADLARLATNPTVFHAAARRMIEDGAAKDSDMAALRIKLHLVTPDAKGILRSTAELAPGLPIQLITSEDRILYGRIHAVGPRGFTVLSSETQPRGAALRVRLGRPTGLYLFRSAVLAARGKQMLLSHSERIKRAQKRRFFRKVTDIPVTVASRNGSGLQERTRLIDLSAGGARIRTEGVRFLVGDTVELVLHPEGGRPITVEGRVTRVSDDGSTMSMAFETITERARERIIRTVFS